MEIVNDQLDDGAFRRALGVFASGVGVITCIDDTGRPIGMTATSFTALSFSPASVLVCMKRTSNTLRFIDQSRAFAVNLLAASSVGIAGYCATSGGDKALPEEWLRRGEEFTSPVLREAITVVDCDVTDRFESGTHSVIIGEVRGVGLSQHRRAADPLIHYRGSFRHLSALVESSAVAPLPIIDHAIMEVI